jgi:hypothetical protein
MWGSPAAAGRPRAWWVVAIPILGFAACRQGGLHPAARDAAQTGGGLSMGGAGGADTGGSDGPMSTGTGGFHIALDVGGLGGSGGRGGGGEAGVVDAQIMLLPDGGCGSEYLLWDAVGRAAGVIGYCRRLEGGHMEWGHIVADGEGWIVYNSVFCNKDGTSCWAEGLQNWLATLEGYRWPCLAGQTIPYYCVSE